MYVCEHKEEERGVCMCVSMRRRRGVYVRVCEHEEEERGVCTCV